MWDRGKEGCALRNHPGPNCSVRSVNIVSARPDSPSNSAEGTLVSRLTSWILDSARFKGLAEGYTGAGVCNAGFGSKGVVFKLQRWLHMVAAILLFMFGLSHLVGVMIGSVSSNRLNVVMPFLTDRQVYVLAGIMEIGVGLLCIIWRGGLMASVMVLQLVCLLVWYRGGQSLVIGSEAPCGCFGVVAGLVGMSAKIEKLISAVVLAVLSFCALPVVIVSLVGEMRYERRKQ